nr:hypothetical protein [Deltaproteobacteria bacterium]
TITDVAAACDSDNPSMFGGEGATGATGDVVFGMLGGTGVYPCTIDIDASLSFQGIAPGIPTDDVMVAAGVPVIGC